MLRARFERRFSREPGGVMPDELPDLEIRLASPRDAAVLQRLAELDSARCPEAPALIAGVAGTPVAAISLVDGHCVADPFRPTDYIAAILRLRHRQLATEETLQPLRVPTALRRALHLTKGGHPGASG